MNTRKPSSSFCHCPIMIFAGVFAFCAGIETASAQGWESPGLAGNLENSTTRLTASGTMTYHDTHHLRPFPSFIFKHVREMHVDLHAVSQFGTPEITRIQFSLRNSKTDFWNHWPTLEPQDVSLESGKNRASFTLDPARLVADLGGIVEYGMTKIHVGVWYDIPMEEFVDYVEFAFVLVPRYRASMHTLSPSLTIEMGEFLELEPSSNPYYGVEPVEVPASGVAIAPDSDTFFFDPPSLSSETGALTFDYFAQAGSYAPDEDRKSGTAFVTVPDASRPIYNNSLRRVFAIVTHVYGDVRIRAGLSGDYRPLEERAAVLPHEEIRMTVRPVPPPGGGFIRPRLSLQFYDGMRANLELTATHTIADKDVVISFDETGAVTERHRNFVTDLSDFVYTVRHNHHEYMRIGIRKTLGFLAGKVTGGFGWVASKGAEHAMEYAVDRVSDANRPAPQRYLGIPDGRVPMSPGTAPGLVEPVGAERFWDVTWSLRADGSVYLENKGSTVDLVAETLGGSGTRMGSYSRARVDLQNETITQAAVLPPDPHLPDIAFLFETAASTVPTTTPLIEIVIPFPSSVYVHPRTLECRLNGNLISPFMRYRYDPDRSSEVASYHVPLTAPLAEGQQVIDVAVLREDGVRYEATSTFTVESQPRSPAGTRVMNGRERICLRWDANPELYITGYRVYRSTAAEDPGEQVGSTTQALFIDADVSAGVTYWYRVQAVGPDRVSDHAPAINGRLNPAAGQDAPDAPESLLVEGRNQAVHLQFDDTAWNAVGWQLERGFSEEGPFLPLLDGELLASTGFVDRHVDNTTTYVYRLTPVGMDGQQGPMILSAPVMPAVPPPEPPTGLTAHRISTGARLRWDPPAAEAAVTAYHIYAASDTLDPFRAATVLAPDVATDLILDTPGVYSFTVTTVGPDAAESDPGGAVLMSCQLESPIVHVAPGSPSPTPPYSSWATAAHDIQSAIDAADDGHIILVSNGIYNTGSRAVFGTMENRIDVDRAVILRSVNGPEHTMIEGQLEYGSWGDTAIRAVYLGTGAVLDGFTVRYGGTRGWGSEFDPIHEQSGGGIWAEAGASIVNCVVVSNYARFGGGIYGCHPLGGSGGIFTSHIRHNHAMHDGGGLNLSTAYNSLISQNQAWTGGGGFSVNLHNCTVTANHGVQRGGIGGGTLVNCIVYGNTDTSGTPNWGSGNMSVDMTYSCTTPAISGEGNISADPRFVDPAGDDFRLSAQSPCIDAGLNQLWMGHTTDLDGNPRVVAARVDMGAYESPYFRDTDQDGIPDWWEILHFGGPTAADANALSANQRDTILESFIAGLDPHDPDASFGTRSFERHARGFELRWPSAFGRVYHVERSSNAAAPQGGFEILKSDIPATPPENLLQDTDTHQQPHFIYRVKVTAP